MRPVIMRQVKMTRRTRTKTAMKKTNVRRRKKQNETSSLKMKLWWMTTTKMISLMMITWKTKAVLRLMTTRRVWPNRRRRRCIAKSTVVASRKTTTIWKTSLKLPRATSKSTARAHTVTMSAASTVAQIVAFRRNYCCRPFKIQTCGWLSANQAKSARFA